MTPFLDELEVQLRGAAEREVASGRRRSVIIAHRLGTIARGASGAAAVVVAILVFGLAVVFLHHSPPVTRAGSPTVSTADGLALPIGTTIRAGTGAAEEIEPGTVRIAATGPDLHGGLPWAVETFRTTDGQTCVLAGRDDSGRLGVIGEGGAFRDDGQFHPYARSTPSENCGQTDGDGHAFIVITEPATPASGEDQDGEPSAGCQPSRESARAAHAEVCPAAEARRLEFGLLGPDATSVTSVTGGHIATTATGSAGAFIVVGPPSKSSFAATVDDQPRSGMVTAVHYRSGSTCRPHRAVPGRHGAAGCPPVGYVAPGNLHVTTAEVRSPITATVTTAKRWCSNASGFYIACDERVPAGYQALMHSGGLALLQWSWTARVAAAGANAGYEYAIKSGPCGGGQSSSGVIPARRGQRIVQQSLGSSTCAQRDTISVEYRTNVGPGGANFAAPPNPGHDGQPFVGSATISVPR